MPKILLTLGSFFVTSAVLEIAARVLLPQFANQDRYLDQLVTHMMASEVRQTQGPNSDPQLGFKISPNVHTNMATAEYRHRVRTNSRGFRSRELTPREPGETRVLFLGDSFFFGNGAEEGQMISDIVEQAGIQAARKVRVFNFSVTGYNTVNEVQLARRHLAEVGPDVVVLGFYTGNDFICNYLADVDADGIYGMNRDREGRLHAQITEATAWTFHSAALRAATTPILGRRLRYEFAGRPEIFAQTQYWIQELMNLTSASKARLTVAILYPLDAAQGGLVARINLLTRTRTETRGLAANPSDRRAGHCGRCRA